MKRGKGTGRSVPKSGPAVFLPHDPTKGTTVPLRENGKRIGSIRMPGVKAPRDLSPDDYAGPRREESPA